ncbi:YkgJ family cysteine cluster protein [Pyrococcus kukulkanii]|uniref:YkgJ family cysteine cluster protein n=1 Tax=Pyrococcus kukulkanii TaxID=1609559 RepID=UPI0035673D00
MERELIAIVDMKTGEVEVVKEDFRFKCVEDCAKCCIENDVPLREEDIERIKALGYDEDYFVDYTKMFYRGPRFLGYAMKKRPFDDACVFLDPETKKCRIYEHRPLACKLYPFILIKHENKLEIYIKKDNICPGINHPEGDPIEVIIEKYFGEVIKGGEDGTRQIGQKDLGYSPKGLQNVV